MRLVSGNLNEPVGLAAPRTFEGDASAQNPRAPGEVGGWLAVVHPFPWGLAAGPHPPSGGNAAVGRHAASRQEISPLDHSHRELHPWEDFSIL